MKMLFPVLFVLIISSVVCEKSSKWCGVPPMCQCFTSMKIIKCEDIRTLPRLTKEDARNTRLLILTGQIQKIPAAIFNRTVFASLEKVNLMKTNILCAEQKDDIIFVSRLCRSTTISVITGKPPSETELDMTTDLLDTNTTWMNNGNSYKTTETPWGIRNGLQLFSAGITLTALNILTALIIMTCVIIRYRRMKNRWIDLKNRQDNVSHVSVETIGAALGDNISTESQELFVAPVASREFGLRSRRSMEKEL